MAFYRYDWNSLVTENPEHRALVPEFMDGEHYFPRRVEMHDALVAFAERAGIDARYELPLGVDRAGGRLASCSGRPTATTGARSPSSPLACRTRGARRRRGSSWCPHYDDLKDRASESFEGKKIFIIGKRNSAFEIADALLPWARS